MRLAAQRVPPELVVQPELVEQPRLHQVQPVLPGQ
jgi:hypothetical protein